MAAPFSISKIIGVSVVVVAMIYIALPMILQAYTPPATNSITSNAYASNVSCNTITAGSLPNASNQYRNAQCLIVTLYGYNSSVLTANKSQYGYIFSLSNSVSFAHNTNSSSGTGFFVNIFQFTGLSFIFSGIGTIAQVMQNLGQIAQVILTTLFLWLPPFESLVIINVIKLITFYVYIRIILLFISAWMKFDLISN